MKSILLISLMIMGILSCTSDKNNKVVEDKIPVDVEPLFVSNSTDYFLNQILGSGNESIRGFNLGDSISMVSLYENWEQFEETEELLGFTFETEDFEIVDVLYFYDSTNTISEVQLDIYLNSDVVSFEMMKALEIYFTQKYGKPNEDFDQLTWNLTRTEYVTIKNIASKLDRGLQINFR